MTKKETVKISFALAEDLLGTLAELEDSGVEIPNYDELYSGLLDAITMEYIVDETEGHTSTRGAFDILSNWSSK